MIEHLDDARWRAAIDADAVGELDQDARAWSTRYVPQGAAARAEHALLAELRQLDADAGRDDEHAIARAVAAALPRPRRWRSAAVLAAAAAVLIAGWAWWRAPTAQRLEPALTPVAFSPPVPVPVPAPVRELDGSTWTLASGELEGAAPTVQPERSLVSRSAACLARAGARVCIDERGEFSTTSEDHGAELRLRSGHARVEVSHTAVAIAPVVVAGVRVLIAPDSEVELEVESQHWSIAVVRGAATVERDGERVQLSRGGRLDSDGRGDEATKSDPTALLARARALRAAGELERAAAAYERLIADHGRSAMARPALVALGEVQLERGRAARALAAFDRYLRRAGPLAEDASYGRIRALRALGRDGAAERASDEFLRRWPTSAYAGRLRRP